MKMSSNILGILIAFFLSFGFFTAAEAYDQHGGQDPKSNITINWDIINWTPDGYVATVTIYNFQHKRHISAPGWRLGWTWPQGEIIWNMLGAQTTEQGDCSRFRGDIPHSCTKNPTVVDLQHGTPYNQQIANCCKGGVLTPWFQYRPNSISAFQISVGQAGTTNRTVRLPRKFTLKAPRDVYTCGPAKVSSRTMFVTSDKRRVVYALMTWKLTCLYSGTR